MKPRLVVPASLQRDEHGVPYSAEYGDIYHPRAGALQQARHVFIGGNGLPERWRGRDTFVVLETGFGLGNNFLATWQAWRDHAQRCDRLVFVSIEQHPLLRADLLAVHGGADSALGRQLADAWPPLTPDLHRLSFEGGRVQLYLALGDVQAWLPALRLKADAFFLDGFAPARNPRMWDERVCAALGRLAAPGATLATWSAASALRKNLATAGFDVRLAPGAGGKRDITLATHAPRHARTPAENQARHASDMSGASSRRAIVIGAGLAGCSVAWALAEQGWSSRVLDRGSGIASQASGNPAGLFHGIVHADDGPHARLHRAASFEARSAVADAIDAHGAAGSVEGLLRIEHRLSVLQMGELLAERGLPAGYVQALDADEASALAGISLHAPAWHYPGGGWVDPAALAASFIARAGVAASVATSTEVHSIRRTDGGLWQALDVAGRVIDSAPVLVVASAGDAARLLPAWLPPLRSVRGQLSWIDTNADRVAAAAITTRIPVADAGYLLPPSRGRIVFGATSAFDDDDASVRMSDHRANLDKLERLVGMPSGIDVGTLGGRTAWRCVAGDRLPLAGAVAALDAQSWLNAARRDQLRSVPRVPGLFVYTALGSRGITWSALGAQVVAAQVAAGVAPLDASLLDALDPARFAVRAARRDQG